MDKVKTFEKELEYIVDDNIQERAKTMIELLPDYFFHEAASSTGKYHPSYALGDGGLVRHTKAAVRVAYELLSDPAIGDKYTRSEKDVMIMSLILHDGLKRGLKEEKYTRFDHPILMANYVLENKDKLKMSDEEVQLASSVIKTHMGPWTTDYQGNEILEKPGKLTDEEFKTMKHHAAYTYYILSDIDDFEEIRDWAAFHHERVDGTGYPFGRSAAELNTQERIMACVDIYQALTESRPYKQGMKHEKASGILWDMVKKGLIDGDIVRQVDSCFAAI